ncbi:hypothetical protein ACFQY5_35885 [Paeniroseomonas aquatica]|uniref:Uncharacterized protein n=1 Tax=Paeniroseomonas aquatica TaxID=373043 RepID=A0ABT8AGB5_9PROT|nr:hypothetical protein [Paeniroseomonas aquatica]MDN3568720.1 hypothetical protein [Paeniroseomonas aquatica]
MFLLRVFWYFVRLALYKCIGLLRFIGKPGSRFIVPVGLVALALVMRPVWHAAITAQLRLADPGLEPESEVLDVVLFVVVAVLIVAYVILSKIMSLTLSAFPLAMRPLWPQRRLEAPKKDITSAVVRIVVPSLPRRRT